MGLGPLLSKQNERIGHRQGVGELEHGAVACPLGWYDTVTSPDWVEEIQNILSRRARW